MGTPKRKTKATTSTTTVDDEEAPRTGSMRPDEMPPEVIEFITAIDDYKRLHRRPFPTWSEVLEILKGLGYDRRAR